jgi:hypothetical protein
MLNVLATSTAIWSRVTGEPGQNEPALQPLAMPRRNSSLIHGA